MPKVNKLQSLIYLSMHLINQDENLKQVMPEMVYTMDENSFVRFLQICGGREIRVPTLDEVAINLMSAVCAYKVLKEHYTLDMIFSKYDIPKDYQKYIKDKLTTFLSSLTAEEQDFIENI